MNTFDQHNAVRYYRHAFADMPVGSPMDGAAYGEYLKSKALGMVIGIVAAVVTMGAGLAVMAAGTLAAQLAGGAMIAGGALSGIGTVTGNKKLVKIGGILSLAGGIGAIGASAATAAGWGGAFEAGSGSAAITDFANNTMSSFSGVFGAGDKAGAVAEGAAGELSVSGSQSDMLAAQNAGIEGADEMTNAAMQSAGDTNNAFNSTTTTATTPGSEQNLMLAQQEQGIVAGSLETPGVGSVSGGATPAAPAEIAAPNVQTSTAAAETGNSAVGTVGDGFEASTAEYMAYRDSPQGVLNRAWDTTKEFAGSSLGKEVIAGGIKQVGGYIMGGGSDMQEFEQQLKQAQTDYYNAGARNVNANASATEAKTAYGNMVPVALDPSDPLYAQKKASADAAGFKTFDIATPAKGQITRAPIQNQFTAPIATAR